MTSSTEALRRDQIFNFQVRDFEVQDKSMTSKNDGADEMVLLPKFTYCLI